jgi:NAD(P)-dependent dehydrogenase (short-subunit alcohol dehydrogenase family)
MLATSLAARSITVNAIAPGPFATDMMAPMVATMGEKIIGAVPLGRMGEGDDIGGVRATVNGARFSRGRIRAPGVETVGGLTVEVL